MLECKSSKLRAVCWKHNADERHLMGKKTQIAKISILPKLIYRFNTIDIKIPARVFVGTAKILFQNVYEVG